MYDITAHVGLEVHIHSFSNSALYAHLQCNNINPVTYALIQLCLPFHTLWVLHGIIIIIITIIIIIIIIIIAIFY